MARTNDRGYRRNREAILSEAKRLGLPCSICGGEMRWDLGAPHPLSPSADHITPFSEGGSNFKSNLRPAHLGCNRDRGTGSAPRSAPPASPTAPPRHRWSRQWVTPDQWWDETQVEPYPDVMHPRRRPASL